MRFKRFATSLTAVALVGTLLLGIVAGFTLSQDDDYFELRKNFQIFGEVYEHLVTGYVDELDPDRLMHVGLDAMLADLDPYTTFIDEADNTDLRIITRGRYGGVGLNVGRRGGEVTVLSPVEGASGYKQGVRAGDVILKINDRPTDALSIQDVQTLLRGEPGTTIGIVVEREGAPRPITFRLMREEVTLDNVAYHGFVGAPEDGVGYVKLERFTRNAGDEVRSALETMKAEQDLQGVVLDLRDNPGGLLEAAVDVAELFVPARSMIVSTRGRNGQTERVYRSRNAPLLPDVPLVVLVNDYSASASEIVAGAIQDLDRGVVYGSTTYGKGLVQVVRALPHNTSLKMTTAKYYIPSGRSIQNVDYARGGDAEVPDSLSRTFETANGRIVKDQSGIEPDVQSEDVAPGELEAALQRRAAFFYYANHFAATRDALPDNFEVDDTLLEDFRTWLDAEGIEYPTDAENALSELEERLVSTGYEDVEGEVAALRKAVLAEKREAFQDDAADLKRHLEREILIRFVGRSEQLDATVNRDPQVQSSRNLLLDASRYTSILTPQ